MNANKNLPIMICDHKTAVWVGCHQDQNGEPLVCMGLNGQPFPIATVTFLSDFIKRYEDQKQAIDPSSVDASIARLVSAEMRKIMPQAIESYNRNPMKRS